MSAAYYLNNNCSGKLSMRPSVALSLKRDAERKATVRYHTTNPCVLCSVLCRTDRDGSDLDLLVAPLPGANLFDLSGLQDELESVLGVDGVDVDLAPPADLPMKYRAKVLAEAQPL